VIRVLFFGTPQFSVPSLEALCSSPLVHVAAVITQPDRPSGRGATVTASPVKLCAKRYGIPVFQPHSLRKELANLKDDLFHVGPFDIGVVIAFGQILPPDVLSFPKVGCVNIHASLLPRWRGAAPIQRAIEAGDSETGVCLMHMDVGLDTGAVFSTARTAILESDSSSSLHDRLSQMGAALLIRDIQAIVNGTLPAIPQSTEDISYAKKIAPEESRIDWSLTATQIARKVRALSPSPGCYTMWQGKRLKVLRARPTDSSASFTEAPGTVIQALTDAVTVCCGSGAVRLEEVQLEGKRKMLAEEFLRGASISAGSRLV
jgi:methionyl-tRNA formyltransferase